MSQYVSIIGYGSLLSEQSAKFSFPNLINFRKGIVKNYRRIFVHHAYIFYFRNIAKAETREVSSCSTEPSETDHILVSVFEIPLDELDAFYEREEEFNFVKVKPFDLQGKQMEVEAIMCLKSSDEEYKQKIGKNFEKFDKYGVTKVWNDDILPCRLYLRFCLLAAMNLGKDVFENFLKTSYLFDRKTTIGDYMKKNLDILQEVPPKELEKRYNLENYESLLKEFSF